MQTAMYTAVAALDAQGIADMATTVMNDDIPGLVANSTDELRGFSVEILGEVASIVEPLLEQTRDSFDNVSEQMEGFYLKCLVKPSWVL